MSRAHTYTRIIIWASVSSVEEAIIRHWSSIVYKSLKWDFCSNWASHEAAVGSLLSSLVYYSSYTIYFPHQKPNFRVVAYKEGGLGSSYKTISMHWDQRIIDRSIQSYPNYVIEHAWETQEAQLSNASLIMWFGANLTEIWALRHKTAKHWDSFVSHCILLSVLNRMSEASITWWANEDECDANSNLIVPRHPLLLGAIGSIDSINLPIVTSDDPEVENATYNGWPHGHFTSCVLVFSPCGASLYQMITVPFI